MLRVYSRSSRAPLGNKLTPKFENVKHDYVIQYGASFKICDPNPTSIWDFAYGVSNVSRDASLVSLPEATARSRFTLETLNLGNTELHPFWLSLGTTEIEREGKFKELLEQRSLWTMECRVCISEALEDIRSYHFYRGSLIPYREIRDGEVGLGRKEKKAMTQEQWAEALRA
ncbi:unnamed protein product [Strongylus vulgaris]|uniref:Uncharacterized protein n=1 Tax=Strongylus vulgaris TaxID=40348 RepID=A0A3P7L6U8_STRVU|nr:unnamed protein product [Strongylus vulgaris]